MTQEDRREHMRRIRKLVSSESCRQNGKKGYAATVKSKGPYFAMEKLQQYRRDHPSNLEQRAVALLAELGYAESDYEREHIIQGEDFCMLVDFAWPEQKVCIEVNGELHERFKHKKRRDEAKAVFLRAAGWSMITLDQHSFHAPDLPYTTELLVRMLPCPALATTPSSS